MKSAPEETLTFSKPTVCIFALFGVLSESSFCLLCKIYTIFLLVGGFYFFVVPFYQLNLDDTFGFISEMNFLRRYVRLIFISAIAVTNIGSKYTSLFLVKKYEGDIIKSLKAADLLLLVPEQTKRFCYWFSSVLTIIIFVFLIGKGLLLFGWRSDPSINIWRFISIGFSYFNNLSVCCTELQFFVLCFSLKLRLRLVNNKLTEMVHFVENFRMYIFKEIMSFASNSKGSTLLRNRAYSLDNLTYYNDRFNKLYPNFINELKNMHLAYCKLIRVFFNIQQMYRVQLLLSTSALFLIILLNIYFLIFDAFFWISDNHHSSNVFWTVHSVLRFVCIVYQAHSTSFEALKAKPLVAAINNRFLDSESKEELLLFLNYISSRKVEFSACGFFTLNTGLITSAIAAGTTYLVILVQFHTTTTTTTN